MLGHSRYSRHSSRSLSRGTRSPFASKANLKADPAPSIAKIKNVNMLKQYLPSEAEMRILLNH